MSNVEIVIATHNEHKFVEIIPLFSNSDWRPIRDSDLGLSVPEVEENGTTFAENALLKAQAFQQVTKMPVVADDSGLEVAALHGQPGVHSNRWHPGSYTDRNKALLDRMQVVRDRSAQFTTVACLLFPNEAPLYFYGVIKGTLATSPRGENGFGYDPLFIPEGFVQTFAELGLQAKEQLSHRARAFKQVVDTLDQRNSHAS